MFADPLFLKKGILVRQFFCIDTFLVKNTKFIEKRDSREIKKFYRPSISEYRMENIKKMIQNKRLQYNYDILFYKMKQMILQYIGRSHRKEVKSKWIYYLRNIQSVR